MASRISQMRNAMYPQTPQHQQQQALNESIERTRILMQQMKGIDPQEIVTRLLQQNPQLGMLSGLLRNGQNLEGIAKSLAQMQGANINDILQQLSNI